MKFKVSYCIEHGVHKQVCDDTALIGRLVVNDSAGVIEIESPSWVCICDGVGGNAGGQEASLFVANSLSAYKDVTSLSDTEELFKAINGKLLDRTANTVDHKQMATTATAIYISDTAIYLVQIGNTRLYAKRGMFLQQMTNDQTTYQWLLDHGNEEAAKLCNRSEIIGAMGGGRSDLISPMVVEQIFERRIPSVIMLSTDGVHEYLTQEELEEFIANDMPIENKPKAICRLAVEKGSDDDRSVILVELVKE